MSQKPLVNVKNLSKVYQDGGSQVTALDNVSFSVAAQESLAIVGPSGSGKTTLLEIMAGLNRPTNGTVFIDGKNVHEGSDGEISAFRNKKVGFVFQLMHLQNYFNASENVTLPLIAKGVDQKEAQKKSLELLDLVGLQKRVSQFPKQLSGGEMQRVAIARALANDPEIIMADEPTGKLDRKNADNVMEIFRKISTKGVSVILITHDDSIAQKFDRIITIEHGKIK